MMRGDGASKIEKPKFTVLNEALIKQCIYVPPSGAEEEKKTRDREQKALQKQHVDFHEVECLMFSFTGISKIDNLVGFDRLTKLQLDNNGIETICNLDHLVNLVWLDLSFNKIKRIQGLDRLTNLEDLTLHCNEIDELDNMQSLKKLRCFSIGKNQLGRDPQMANPSGTHDLDGIAKYLRKFRQLKMLTLAGNPVQTKMVPTVYESKLLAHLGGRPEEPGSGLKYLDYRLVSPQRVRDAKAEHREVLMGVEESDRKEQEKEEQEEREAKERAELRDCNCEGITTLFDVLFTEGSDAKTLEDFENYDDTERLRQAKASYRAIFDDRVKSFRDDMKKQRDKKSEEIQQFRDCLAWDQEGNDMQAKALIKAFEKKKKKVMPAHDGHPTEEEEKRIADEFASAQQNDRPSEFERLQQDLYKLKEELLERETDQQEAYEAVIGAFEDAYKVHMEETTDQVITKFFAELQAAEGMYKGEMAKLFEDMMRERHSKQGGGGGAGADAVGGVVGDTGDDQDAGRRGRLESLLENKEEIEKLIEESHQFRTSKLYDIEGKLTSREKQRHEELVSGAREEEHRRNRQRVCEINMYCALVEHLIRDADPDGGDGYNQTEFRGTNDAFSGR